MLLYRTNFEPQPVNILLVEDNIINQKVTAQFLTKWGLNVTIANHGKEAVELVLQKNFNLILMDLNMPEMDGCEATRHIRSMSDPYFKNVPILAFTASSLADSKEKAEQLGMNDFLSKPLNPQEMHSKISYYTAENPQDIRPLNIRLQAYNSADADFKLSLIHLMTNNIHELQQAVYCAIHTHDIKGLNHAYHKAKSTLTLLNDREFSELISHLIESITHGENKDERLRYVNKFNQLSHCMLKKLDREAQWLTVKTSTSSTAKI